MNIQSLIGLSILIILCFSFCLLASVVLIYYVRRRYLLHLDIKSISQDELMLQSFQNHRENQRIKALISNFIVIIVIIEILIYLSYSLLCINYLEEYSPTFKNRLRVLTKFSHIYKCINVISYFCHLPILSLLLKVLWLIYIRSPYKYTIIRWTWYIVIRCVLFSIFCYFQITSQCSIGWHGITCSTIALIDLFVNTSDLIIYLVYARRMYIQLKSRETEAYWFKDRAEYLTARSLRLHYKIATILVTIAVCSTTIFQNLSISETILSYFIGHAVIHQIDDFYKYSGFFEFLTYILLFNLNYLYIVSMMVFKYCKQKRQLTNVNNKIKPLIENYHTHYYTRY